MFSLDSLEREVRESFAASSLLHTRLVGFRGGRSVLLVVFLQSRNEVGLVAGLGELLLGKELLQLRHLERGVVGHCDGGL